MIPVIVKKKGQPVSPLASGPLRYVIAKGGVYLERNNEMFYSCVKVPGGITSLDEQEEDLKIKCPPIPAEMVNQAVSFFRWAYVEHGGEAVLLLLYNKQTQEFMWHCPEQWVEQYTNSKWTSMDIHYKDPLELPAGYVQYGDVHSHCSMAAYTSGTDSHDEKYKDGIHIIIGKIDDELLDVHVDFVVDKHRFKLAPELVMPSLTRVEKKWSKWAVGKGEPRWVLPNDYEDSFDPEWMEEHTIKEVTYTKPVTTYGGTSAGTGWVDSSYKKPAPRYKDDDWDDDVDYGFKSKGGK